MTPFRATIAASIDLLSMSNFLSPQPSLSSSYRLNGEKPAIVGGIVKRPVKIQNPRRSQRFG
jgi:hypothetical protein